MEKADAEVPVSMDLEKGTETASSALDSVKEQTSAQAAPEQVLTGIKLYATLAAVMIAGFLIMLDSSIVVTAIPRITAHFNSIEDIGWYGSAYLVANCACQLNSGKIYQYHSTKTTFLVFISIFELGSLICALATSSSMLIVGRAVAGVGGSGIMNGGFVVIATVSAEAKRPFYLGLVMGFVLLGIVAGPLLGGLITQDLSWRWCFYINLPIGGFTMATIFLTKLPTLTTLKNTDQKQPSHWEKFLRLDPVGFVTFAPFCLMLLIALQWGGTKYPWSSATIIGLLCGSVADLCIFVAWEYHHGDKGMMPLSLLRQQIVYSSCIVCTLQFGTLQIFVYYLPLWFQVIKDASPIMSGVYFMGTVIPQIIFAVVSGGLTTRLGYYTPFSISGNAICAIGAGLLSTLTISSSPGRYIGYQVLFGAGRGLSLQQPIAAVQRAVPTSQISVGTALVTFTQFFGGSVFIALAQTTFTNSLGPALDKFAPGIDAQFVINTGATDLRHAVPPSDLNGVLLAYNQSLLKTCYLAIGLSVGAFIGGWGMGIRVNVKKAKEVEKAVVSSEGEEAS